MFRIEVIYNFKNSKFAQILHVDKTCFLRPGHKYEMCVNGRFSKIQSQIMKMHALYAIKSY